MQKVFAFTAAIMLFSCSTAPAQQGNEVAARVGDRVITVKELEDKWRGQNPSQHAEAMQTLYEGRRNALDQIVADMLLAEAAKSKGMSPEAYAESEIARRAKKITDADVVAFYQANLNQMQGRTLDQVAPAINRFLTDQEEQNARTALVAELRKAGPAVRVMLDVPRAEIAVASTDPALGPATAPVTIVEFSDFQCPFCQRAAPTLKRLRDTYGDKVRVVWKDYPLTQIHPQAFKAAEASHCAAEQGKFWEYHDRLFANQQALQVESLKQYAKDLSLDVAKFDGCVDSSKYAERVRDGVAAGTRLGVNSTPTVYVNGRRLEGAQPYEVFTAVVDEELSRQ